MKTSPVFLSLFLTLFLLSCDDSFSPSGPVVNKMVVYSILSTESDVQYVRVYSNYYPSENNPANNIVDTPVEDALVIVTGNGITYTFHDTLVARDDTSRYKESVFAYVANGFRPMPGEIYTLSVVSPTHGSTTATTRIPSSSTLSNRYTYVYEMPYHYPQLSPQILFTLSAVASAYKIRFYIEYEADTDQGRQVLRREVPEDMFAIDCLLEIFDYRFPKIHRKVSVGSTNLTPQSTQYFSHFAYRRSIEFIYSRNLNPILRKVIFYNAQFDENWYKYYATARTFRDQYTVRLDEPDFSNLQNGIGLFGSLTVDSTSSPLPMAILWPFIDRDLPNTCGPDEDEL